MQGRGTFSRFQICVWIWTFPPEICGYPSTCKFLPWPCGFTKPICLLKFQNIITPFCFYANRCLQIGQKHSTWFVIGRNNSQMKIGAWSWSKMRNAGESATCIKRRSLQYKFSKQDLSSLRIATQQPHICKYIFLKCFDGIASESTLAFCCVRLQPWWLLLSLSLPTLPHKRKNTMRPRHR